MTKNQKIIVDTNILVAAGILVNIQDLDIQVKHDFYDTSRQLFSIFSKRPREQIGILVPTVKKESFKVLSKAVKKSMGNIQVNDIRRKEVFYNNTVAMVNSCEYKMRQLSSLLLEKKPHENEIYKNFRLVKDMSMYLREIWNTKYKRRFQKEKETKNRARPATSEPRWKPEQKTEVINAYREQISIESRQLHRFMQKYPNWDDQQILAETITVKQDYHNINEDYDFFIASYDMGFFRH